MTAFAQAAGVLAARGGLDLFGKLEEKASHVADWPRSSRVVPRREDPITLAVVLPELWAKASVRLGEDVGPLLESAGITMAERADPNRRIDLDVCERLWDVLAEHTGDPAIGLRCASRLDIEAYGVFGLAVRSSSTVRECVDIANECLCLLHDASRIRLVEHGETSRLVYEFVGTERRMHLHSAALMIAATVELFRRLIVSQWSPTAVYFEGPAPADVSPYEAQLGVPVHFGADEHAIAFASVTLHEALLSGDRSLSSMYRARVSAILDSRRKQQSESDETLLLARARDVIGAALGNGEPSLEDVARSLALSSRTLQRRLRGAGITFQLLLDRTRQEMALSLLKSGVAVEDVPPLIGYADVNAYRRAFRRWTSQGAR